MSKIEVNAIEPQCGTTLTVGASGDTITFPTGTTIVNNGTQTGFGRTGTVDWQTSIKTTSFTAVSGEGYFVNTTSGAITMTLPASPSVGDIVSVKDYAQTFNTNNLTVGRNSEPIEGETFDLLLDTLGVAITLIYGDATKGWQSVNSNEVINQQLFVAASGGTETTSGDFKIHTFTGPGTFTVSCAGNPSGSNSVSYMVVAGGGGGGGTNPQPSGGPYSSGGGGGGGGYREGKTSTDCYTASPLNAPEGVPVTATAYPITVGGGGAGGPGSGIGVAGSNSVFSTITSAGGGFGTHRGATSPAGSGGSGGGGSGNTCNPSGSVAGSGNTPPVSPPQGSSGGNGSPPNYPAFGANAGGGGGATAVGVAADSSEGGDGGAGATSSINGTPTARSGGGGGGVYTCGSKGLCGSGAGGTGGAGPGGPAAGSTSPGNGQAGTTNTGGGGGGGSTVGPDGTKREGGAGGSGIVIIRYKFQ